MEASALKPAAAAVETTQIEVAELESLQIVVLADFASAEEI